MQTQALKEWLRTSTALVLTLGVATHIFAVGPSNQVVPNPAPGGTNTLSSVVGVARVEGTITSVATGTMFNSFLRGGNCFLCVLTANHNFDPPGVANSIIFPNHTLGAAPPARTYPIINRAQVAGLNAMQNVDASVALVRYGAPDAFHAAVPNKALAAAVAVDQIISVVGFGDGGTPVLDGMGNVVGLNVDTQNDAVKRYMNNRLAEVIADYDPPGVYRYSAIRYDFSASNAPEVVPGEGATFVGDSGSPVFNGHVDFNPGGGLPLIFSVDNIAGVHTLGSSMYVNGTSMHAVDAVAYRANILTACNNLVALIPEPGSLMLLAVGGYLLMMLCRRRLCHFG